MQLVNPLSVTAKGAVERASRKSKGPDDCVEAAVVGGDEAPGRLLIARNNRVGHQRRGLGELAQAKACI